MSTTILSNDATTALARHHVGAPQIEVAMAMLDCLREAADDVAEDTREEAFDDATSRGGLLYRRARNRILDRFHDVLDVVCDTTDNALHVRTGDTAISFYSARNGLDNPDVSGSVTKQRVVDESQMAFDLDDQAKIPRLVIMYEASPDGMVRAALGVLESATKWAWRVTIFDRFALGEAVPPEVRVDSYDERPEPEISITRKSDAATSTVPQ